MKNNGTFTPQIRERFRTIPPRFELNDLEDVDLDDFEVTNYVLGDRCAKTMVKKDHFDTISVVSVSECPIKRTRHVHALGYRAKEKKNTMLILSEIKRK